MRLIHRAIALTAVTVMAALVTVTATACGTTTTTRTTTNGLETKTAADVLQEAAGALGAAKSVHLVGTGPSTNMDARIQGSSATGTFGQGGAQIGFTIVGNATYIKTGQAGLKALGAPEAVQRQYAGQWLKVSPRDVMGFSLADLASQLTTYQGPLEPKVRQATLNGTKVVVVSWQNGGKLYVANTGPAYPLRGEFTGQDAGVMDFTEYGTLVGITAPASAIDLTGTL